MENKVKSLIVLNEVTLESTETTTQAAANRRIVDTFTSDQINLVVKYTTGAGETLNNCYVKIWGYIGVKSTNTNYPYATTQDTDIAADSENWVQIGTYDLSSGTATFTASVFKVAGALAATTYTAYFATGITFPKIRISAFEDGVATNKGTITVNVLVQ